MCYYSKSSQLTDLMILHFSFLSFFFNILMLNFAGEVTDELVLERKSQFVVCTAFPLQSLFLPC